MLSIVKIFKTVIEVLVYLKDFIETAQYFYELNEQYQFVHTILVFLQSIEWPTLIDRLHNMPMLMLIERIVL